MFKTKTSGRSLSIFSALLMLQFAVPLPLLAQAAHSLNLSSPQKTIPASTIVTQPVTFHEGSTTKTVTSSSMLTPAEFVAVSQIVSSGTQSILLNALGEAHGGGFVLNSQITGGASDMVIPKGVTGVQNLGILSTLNLSSDLTNAGKLLAISTNTAANSATLSADNIYNLKSGIISSLASDATAAGLLASAFPINLTLNAVGQIVNSGRISSSGTLDLSAGSSITNSGTMQAASDVNLQTTTLNNSGTISSIAGNINISSALPSDIVINNTNGELAALSGAINIRDASFTGAFDTTLTGGDWLSQTLNVYSGCGTVTANVNNVTGVVTGAANNFHFNADAANLQLGTIQANDPVFTNIGPSDDITITANQSFPTSGVAYLATGNIIATSAVSSISANGDITMSAGRIWEATGGGYKIVGACCTGGSIDFSQAASNLSITSNGGRITMLATEGGFNHGYILMPSGSTIDSSGTTYNGNIYIMAGPGDAIHNHVTNSNFDVINIGTVKTGDTVTSTTNPTTGDEGNILITTAFAQLSTGGTIAPCTNCIQLDSTGALVAQADINISPATVNNASISTGSIIGGGGSSTITLQAGHNLLVNGVITNNGVTAGTAGGTISVTTTVNNAFVIGTQTSGTQVNGVTGIAGGNPAIAAVGNNGVGGTIEISASSASGITFAPANSNISAGTLAGSGGAGGSVNVSTPAAILSIPSTTHINADGSTANNGNGGSISLSALGLNGTATLSAQGGGTGNGGSVSLTSSGGGSDGDIAIGGASQLAINASASGSSGNGGSLTVSAGRDLNVTVGAGINVAPAANGNGATYSLAAGGTVPGNLSVSASLTANGSGTGTGGNITLNPGSDADFTVNNGATANGVNGTLSANSGASSTASAGGSVTISNNRAGAVDIDGTGVAIMANGAVSGANGGKISISASGVNVASTASLAATAFSTGSTGDEGSISLTSTGSGGIVLASLSQLVLLPTTVPTSYSGGTISLISKVVPLNLPAGTINVSGVGTTAGTANGGTITLEGPTITWATGTLALVANGDQTASGVGNGGNITVTTTDNTSAANITVGLSSGQILTLSANGGTTNGAGGTLTLSSGGSISVTNVSTAFTAIAQGGNAAGGNYILTSGAKGDTTVTIDATTGGPGYLNANGIGAGGGGQVEITSNSATPFIYNATGPCTNCLIGTIQASSGNGQAQQDNVGTVYTDPLNSPNNTVLGQGTTWNTTLTNPPSTFEIGFGSQNPSLITQFFPISTIPSNTSLTLANQVKVTEPLNTPYVIVTIGETMAGGTIKIVNNGSGGIQVGGALNAASNSSGAGAGGNITLSSNGPITGLAGAPLDLSDLVVTAGSGGGFGGSVTLNSPNSTLNVTGNLDVQSTANTNSTANGGGSIVITAAALTNTGGQVTLNASDATSGTVLGTGPGGSVSITTTRPGAPLNAFLTNFAIEANGGSAGSAAGDGGSVTLSANGNISIDMSTVIGGPYVTAGPLGLDGKGATYSFTAGGTVNGVNVPGNVAIYTASGTISASGVGTGDGGSIKISSTSATPFVGGAAIFVGGNGTDATAITANGGATAGAGGTVSITNNAAGGIDLSAMSTPSAISVTAVGDAKAGGTISFTTPGTLVLPGGLVLNTNGSVTANTSSGSGGSITIAAGNLSIAGGGSITLNANGEGVGNGGTVSVVLSNAASNLTVGSGGQIAAIYASGGPGTTGTTGGNGGSLTLSAGSSLNVDMSVVNTQNTDSDSNGASFNFTAGTAAPGSLIVTGNITSAAGAYVTSGGSAGPISLVNTSGNVYVNGTISATTTGPISGGAITLTSNSSAAFDLGAGATTTMNGVTGTITNQAQGPVAGDKEAGAGSLTVTNSGVGGIVVENPNNIIITTVQGNGGTVSLNAPKGAIQMGPGTLSVNGNGADSSDAGCCSGGTINITGQSLVLSTAGNTELQADGSFILGTGISSTAGTVNVNITGATSSLNVGLGNQQLSIDVSGGRIGGIINLTVGGNMTIDPSAIAIPSGAITMTAVNPNNARGYGRIYVTSGFMNTSGVVEGPGADAAGGSVIFSVNSELPFTVAQGATLNGVNGTIDTQGGSGSGEVITDGGNVSISNKGSGGIRLGAFSSPTILTDAGANGGGFGGSITLSAATSVLFQGGAVLQANGSCGNGGAVTISAQNTGNIPAMSTGALSIIANGAADYAGGVVTIDTTSTKDTVVIGTGAGDISVTATGGSTGSLGGDGGTLDINSAKGITIVASALNLGPIGADGGGASLDLVTANNGALSIKGRITGLNGGGIDGSGFGNGGSVNITFAKANINTRTANIPLSINAGAAGGNGGTLILTANGALTFGTGAFSSPFLVTANAVAPANSQDQYNGGTIKITAGAIKDPFNNLQFQANGAGGGNGGTIDLTTNGSITNGTGFGQIRTIANGGTDGGNGGTLTLSAGGLLTVNPSALIFSAAPSINGNGGTLTLIGGAKGIVVKSGLSADGVGDGNGGSITIETSSTKAMSIGTTGVISRGVRGAITANGGDNGGEGTGGSITITASSSNVSIGGVGISAVGVGTDPEKGGTITLSTKGLAALANTTPFINASGGATGNGGAVSITTLKGNPVIGTGKNRLDIEATGGSTTSREGNGGSLTYDASGSLTVQASGISLAPQGFDGNGATLLLSAKVLSINTSNSPTPNTLVASGVGEGIGGSITLNNASGLFKVGAGANGANVNGNLDANAGALGTTGGSVTITSAGGVQFLSGVTVGVQSSATSGGSGGEITVSSTGGNILFSGSGAGLNANGSGTAGNGGLVNLFAKTIGMPSGATISADGSGTGNGGTISVTSTNAAGSITLGNSAGQMDLLATGGSAGSNAGDGGKITVSSAANLTVNSTGLNAAPQGSNGAGAKYSLTASGTLLVNTPGLSANAVGIGNGGSITLAEPNTKITSAFTIGTGATNGVNGTLSANAQQGNGGTVTVTYGGKNGITLTNPIDVSTQNGTGGAIALTATNSTLTVNATSLSANGAGGSGANSGGSIALTGKAMNISSGGLALAADGAGSGNGGNIAVTISGNTGTLTVDTAAAANTISVSATGGSSTAGSGGSLGGNGGSVSISAPSLTVNGNALTVAPVGDVGNGGNISLTATTLVVRNTLSVSGAASANGAGNGGALSLKVGGPSFTLDGTTESLAANGGTVAGSAGSVNITTTGGLNLTNTTFANEINLNTVAGNGGNINLSAGTAITLGFSSIAESGGGALSNSNGGVISMTAGALVVPTGAPFVITNNGSGTGTGGTINLSFAKPVVIGTANGDVALNAVGGTDALDVQGQGGTISVSSSLVGTAKAPNTLTVDGSAINVGGGVGGIGGTISVKSGGAVAVTNAIVAGFGNNGILNVTAGGTGGITESGGVTTLEATVVNLAAGTGAIGTISTAHTVGVPLQTDALTLSINSSGVSNVDNAQGMMSINTSKGTTMNITGTGYIATTGVITANALTLTSGADAGITIGNSMTGTVTSNTITLATSGVGYIQDNNGILSASKVALTTGTGDIGNIANPVAVSNVGNGGVTLTTITTGNIYAQSSRALTLTPITSTPAANTNISIIASGNFTIPNAFTSTNYSSLTFGALDASLTAKSTLSVKFDLTAPDVTLYGGSITQTKNTLITATDLTINSLQGSVGTSATALNVDADFVSAVTGGTGLVNIKDTATTTVDLVNSGGGNSFKFVTGGGLDVSGNIFANNGSLTLVATSGALVLDDDGLNLLPATPVNINVHNGNIVLQNLSTAAGSSIELGDPSGLGDGVTIIATAKAGLGNVRIFLGASAGKPVAGTAPSNVTVAAAPNNFVYFGTNSITANGTTANTILTGMKGAQLQFNAPTAAQIEIGQGGAIITADPPAPVHVTPAQLVLPTAIINAAPSDTHVQPAPSNGTVSLVIPAGATSAVLSTDMTVHSGQSVSGDASNDTTSIDRSGSDDFETVGHKSAPSSEDFIVDSAEDEGTIEGLAGGESPLTSVGYKAMR